MLLKLRLCSNRLLIFFLRIFCLLNREWYRGFKHDCPNGQLTKQTIVDICNTILPGGNSSTFVDQIFRIFDKDNSGTIDFKEFMLATDMTSAGTAEEKLAWAFKVSQFRCIGINYTIICDSNNNSINI